MTRLKWGEDSKRTYESGIDRGVLYPNTGPGVAWNGLISVVDAPAESEESQHYIDGVKYQNRQNSGSFSATIEAFTYPDEFLVYDGISDSMITQQSRKSFGLCYRTKIGNIDGLDAGYKIHLVYNALAAPTEKDYTSIGDSVDPINFSWGITTTPVPINGARASAHLIIDMGKAYASSISPLEDILYGTDTTSPSLPSPNDVLELFESYTIFRVTDNGDGTYTVTGLDDIVHMTNSTTFQISHPSAVSIDETTYTITSL